MELLHNAFTGVNLIPTILLVLMVLYWIIAIIGALDFDFLDIDLDGQEGEGPFYSLAVFLKVGSVPVGLVFSLLILNFWILSMFLYYLPIEPGGLVNGLLLIPTFVIGLFITKFEVKPLRKIFKDTDKVSQFESTVIDHRCRLLYDVSGNQLGQGELILDGKSLVVNVKAEFQYESFKKDEIAFITRKDEEKNVYYITKTIINKYIYNKDGGQ